MSKIRARSLLPDRTAWIDLGFVLATGLVAMYGFRNTFVDLTFMLAGGLGLLLGIAVAHVANVLRQPLVVTVVFTVVAFFLLGGAVALHGKGAAGLFPVPGTLAKLADQSVHGWKELLTTLPPVDSGPLLSLPYLMGLIAGAAGVALATRLRWPAAPALSSVALLSAVILLGVQTPGSVLALGAVFSVLTIIWVILRARQAAPDRALPEAPCPAAFDRRCTVSGLGGTCGDRGPQPAWRRG